MSNLTTLWIISLVVLVAFPLIKPQTYGKGKLLTMPMRRFKVFNHPYCRSVQIIALYLLWLALHPFLGKPVDVFYYLMIIALFMDDWFSEDDNFKKWWMEVRNKIKWKMELPVPATDKVKS